MLFFWDRRKKWRWLLPLYPLAMAFSLVYTGEHYVFDILLGWVYAATIYFVGTWAMNAWFTPARGAPGCAGARRGARGARRRRAQQSWLSHTPGSTRVRHTFGVSKLGRGDPDRAGERGPGQPRPAELGPSQVGVAQRGVLEVGVAQVGELEVRVVEVGALEVAPARIAVAQVARVRSEPNRSAWGRSAPFM